MPSILIIGLGLVGGSAGMALRGRGWRVSYIDPHVTAEEARAAGAADERLESAGGADAGVTLLATPVDVALDLMQRTELPGVVTSACSVMRPLRVAARGTFVAGHPMAGSQRRGLPAATASLFEGKTWFVDADDERVEAVIRDCGAVRERVEAAEHDAAVALTSHLPQVLSTALAAYLHGREDVLRFAGNGLRTFLRLAGSDSSVWAPVLEANRDNLAPHAEGIAALVRELTEGDPRDAFAKAQAVLQALEARPH
jgi:prephenate dehydrogenase